VTFGLIVGGRPTSVSVDNYPYKGYRSGLRLVDGRNVAENETGLAGQVLYQGAEPTRIVMTVRGEHVTVACEDNVVVDWAGDSNRLSVHSTNAAVPDGQLFLALHKGAIRVTELKLRPIDMTTEPANPGPGTD
jgi:hypothetical protein